MQQNVLDDVPCDIINALQWYIDNGVDEAWADDPINAFEQPVDPVVVPQLNVKTNTKSAPSKASKIIPLSELTQAVIDTVNQVGSLDELKKSINEFDIGELKQMATNLVFANGDHQADLMIINDAPTSDDDRSGEPISGVDGQLLDKAISFIGRSRNGCNDLKTVYVTSLLNWRPAGNRSPTNEEISMSLPFLERHISLVKPKMILALGAATAKALTGKSEGISRLRKQDHVYQTQTLGLTEKLDNIPLVVSYNMVYLREMPAQKKAFWQDLLKINLISSKL